MTYVFPVGSESQHDQHGEVCEVLPESAIKQFREREQLVKTHHGGRGKRSRDKEGLGGSMEVAAA